MMILTRAVMGIVGLLVLLRPGLVHADRCKAGTLTATTANGSHKVELTGDRGGAKFYEMGKDGKYVLTEEVVLSYDIRGCGQLLIAGDGQAFFFLRSQGLEADDDRRLIFYRRGTGGAKGIYKKLGFSDLGFGSADRTVSHTHWGNGAKIDEKEGILDFGNTVKVSIKDGSVIGRTPPPAPAEDEDDAAIKRHLEKLGSSDADEREKGRRRLLRLGEKAIPALKAAAASENLRLRLEAEVLLKEITPPSAKITGNLLFFKSDAVKERGGRQSFLSAAPDVALYDDGTLFVHDPFPRTQGKNWICLKLKEENFATLKKSLEAHQKDVDDPYHRKEGGIPVYYGINLGGKKEIRKFKSSEVTSKFLSVFETSGGEMPAVVRDASREFKPELELEFHVLEREAPENRGGLTTWPLKDLDLADLARRTEKEGYARLDATTSARILYEVVLPSDQYESYGWLSQDKAYSVAYRPVIPGYREWLKEAGK